MNKPIVMLIADGSRRWARCNNVTIEQGYAHSSKILADHYCYLSDKVDTLFVPVCTINNLKNRPPEQVSWFLDCFISAAQNAQCGIHLEVRGDTSSIPVEYVERFNQLEKLHSAEDGLKIVYLVGWSSDFEVFKLCKSLVDATPESLEELRERSVISERIDLIIRCGKVQRLSAMIP